MKVLAGCTWRCEGFSNGAHESVKVSAVVHKAVSNFQQWCTLRCEGFSNGAHEGVRVSVMVHMKV